MPDDPDKLVLQLIALDEPKHPTQSAAEVAVEWWREFERHYSAEGKWRVDNDHGRVYIMGSSVLSQVVSAAHHSTGNYVREWLHRPALSALPPLLTLEPQTHVLSELTLAVVRMRNAFERLEGEWERFAKQQESARVESQPIEHIIPLKVFSEFERQIEAGRSTRAPSQPVPFVRPRLRFKAAEGAEEAAIHIAFHGDREDVEDAAITEDEAMASTYLERAKSTLHSCGALLDQAQNSANAISALLAEGI
jgi:hypothetical protein